MAATSGCDFVNNVYDCAVFVFELTELKILMSELEPNTKTNPIFLQLRQTLLIINLAYRFAFCVYPYSVFFFNFPMKTTTVFLFKIQNAILIDEARFVR